MTERGGTSLPAAAPSGAVRPLLPQMRSENPARSLLERLLAVLSDAFEHRRLIVLVPFALIAGLIFYAALPVEPQSWALGVAGAVLILSLALARNTTIALRLCVLAASFWIGFCLLPLHGAIWGTPMLEYPAYGTYQARVDTVLSQTDTGGRIVISSITPQADARPVPVRRARIVVPGDIRLQPGDILRANLRLAPVPGPILPGAFDGQFHAYFDGIGAYGNVTSDLDIVSREAVPSLAHAVDTLRHAIGARIDAVLEGPPAAIAWAMTVGDQSYIDDETREVMAAAGLAHIYSISGLHLSIVAGGVFVIVRILLASLNGLTGRLPVKKIAAIAGIVSACAYLMLAGGIANIPAFRSTLMLVLIFGAVLAGRHALTMRNVALAAIVIVLIDPASVFRASFQLSFAAVVGLIGIYELPRRTPETRGIANRWLYAIWVTALTSLIAGTATLLFSAYHFQQTAPLGVLGNVLALPVLSFVIMPMGVLAVLAMPFGVDPPFLAAMGWGIERMLDIATFVATWSQGLETNPLLTPTALLIGLAALAWFALLRDRLRLLGPALAIPLLIAFGFDTRPDILIADTTQSVAVAQGPGMGLLAGRTGSFAVDVWSEHYDWPIAADLAGARCDSVACIYADNAFSLSYVRSPEAFHEDCARHDLVITRLYAPRSCRTATQVIDAGDLAHGGVHWLRWNEGQGGFEIRAATTNLARPWRAGQR